MLGSISKWFWIFLIPAGADERLKACPARWSATNAAGQGGKMLIALSAISVTYLDIPRLWMTMDDYGVTRAHPSMLPALDDWISMNFPFVQHRGATTERMLTFKITMQWYDLIYIWYILYPLRRCVRSFSIHSEPGKKGVSTNLLASSLSRLSCFARSMTCVLNLGLVSRSFNAWHEPLRWYPLAAETVYWMMMGGF